jgi:transcriptional antiterminator RfaH
MAPTIQNLEQKNNASWVVAYTRSRAEKEVDLRLGEKGLISYLPVIKSLRQWSDRKKWIEVPLFKSYVFVNVNKTDYYKAITTTGIIRFITNCGKPLKVSDQEIDVIRKIADNYSQIEICRHKFSIGDRVLITKGSLKGTNGILVEFRGKHRVAIMIGSLGFSLLLDISLDHLQLIEK